MIGVFDSGVGGLTVVKEIFSQLPGYDVVYLGDTARTPYGNKSPERIQEYALQDAQFLINQGAKVIVIACNTASANAYSLLTSHFKLPIFEVITPAAARAVELTKKRRVGIIGTRATVSSGAYEKEIKKINSGVTVISVSTPLFVPLIEEGWAKRAETKRIVRVYLQGIKTKSIDTLVLGCTHYPLIKDTIQAKMGRKTKLVDPSEEVVKRLKQYLSTNQELDEKLTKKGNSRFFVTDITEHFHAMAQSWLKRGIKLEKITL